MDIKVEVEFEMYERLEVGTNYEWMECYLYHSPFSVLEYIARFDTLKVWI